MEGFVQNVVSYDDAFRLKETEQGGDSYKNVHYDCKQQRLAADKAFTFSTVPEINDCAVKGC